MSVKITVPNNSSDYLTFGSANTPTAAQVGGYDDGSSNGHMELYTTASGVSTERMRIESSGNVCIGTSTSGGYKLKVNSSLPTGIAVVSAGSTSASPTQDWYDSTNTTEAVLSCSSSQIDFGAYSNSPLAFRTNNIEKMRLDASGNLLINGTSAPVSTALMAITNGTIKWSIGPNSAGNFLVYNGSSIGVYINNGSTSWTGTSDARLKNVTGTFTNALDDIAKIQAVKFTWKSDKENTPQVGVIAQSVQEVLPEAVSQAKVVEGDDTEYLGVRYTELIPLMIAAIQEQQAIIGDLKARIETLEAK